MFGTLVRRKMFGTEVRRRMLGNVWDSGLCFTMILISVLQLSPEPVHHICSMRLRDDLASGGNFFMKINFKLVVNPT